MSVKMKIKRAERRAFERVFQQRSNLHTRRHKGVSWKVEQAVCARLGWMPRAPQWRDFARLE